LLQKTILHVAQIDKGTIVASMVTKEDWAIVCPNIKDQCTFVAKGLIVALDRRFPAQELMNANGIIYM
jgi:hypothetical protein